MEIRTNALVIIRKDDHVLVQRGEDKNNHEVFYRILGGGIEFGEKSKDTIKREFMEELGVTIVNEKFLSPIENIFEFNGNQYHEITFLYEAEFENKDLYNLNKMERIDFSSESAEWISIKDVKDGNVIFYPREAIEYL